VSPCTEVLGKEASSRLSCVLKGLLIARSCCCMPEKRKKKEIFVFASARKKGRGKRRSTFFRCVSSVRRAAGEEKVSRNAGSNREVRGHWIRGKGGAMLYGGSEKKKATRGRALSNRRAEGKKRWIHFCFAALFSERKKRCLRLSKEGEFLHLEKGEGYLSLFYPQRLKKGRRSWQEATLFAVWAGGGWPQSCGSAEGEKKRGRLIASLSAVNQWRREKKFTHRHRYP